MVRASVSDAEGREFENPTVSYQRIIEMEIATASLGAQHYEVSVRTGQPGIRMMWLGGTSCYMSAALCASARSL